MKKTITVLFLIAINLVSAQAFKGKGDDKFSVGANLQNEGAGLQVAYDLGMGPNISLGFTGGYLMSVDENPIKAPELMDKIDFKARFNAHLCDVIGINQLDVYPGLNIGLRNFGGHIGVRYFFSEGFGIFTEGAFPIAKYDDSIDKLNYEHLNNQFTLNIGAVFSMN